MRTAWLTVAALLFVLKDIYCGPYEKMLLKHLLYDYERQNRPVLNETEPLVLTFGITLQQIIDVDEKNQLLITCLWLNLDWVDYQLNWNASEYGGIDSIRIHPKLIWTPDLLMYNSADEKFDGTYQTNVVVSNEGSCLYVPPGIFKSTCKIDITWFPFDDQLCDLKFGSWTYSGWKLDLALKQEDGGDISGFVTNGEWDLIGVPGKKNIITYDCCPEPYVDITFTIHIRRRTLYYFFNLIVPCVLISSMALLGFTLPPDSGEKLTLDVTVLLSLTMFLNQVSDSMPKTSDAVPLISTYFNCIMMMVASSVVLTVVVLNYHHRTAETHVMPTWVKSVFLQWLPWILRMSRPGKKITRKTITMNSKMNELQLKEKACKSLLANVLDMDDDLRALSSGGGFIKLNGFHQENNSNHSSDMNHVNSSHVNIPSACSSANRELKCILKEMRFMTNRLKAMDEENEIESDWKFAAMVIDRFCLIIFTTFTIVTTIAVLFSAPHILVE